MNPSSPADIARRVTAPDSVYPPDHELRILAEGYNADSLRLEFLVSHSHIGIYGNDERGWVVWDQGNGLIIAGRGNTARAAIDAAMSKLL